MKCIKDMSSSAQDPQNVAQHHNHYPLSHITEFDGVRGMLAVWVMMAHMACWTGLADQNLPGPFGALWKSLTSAQAAVDVFIILSGFVITFLISQKQPSYGLFITGRWLRIFPAYFIALTAGVLTSGLAAEVLQIAGWRDKGYFDNLRSIGVQEQLHPVAHSILHITLLQGLVPAAILPQSTATFLPPGWSISLEWQFYLAAPLILRLLRSAPGFLILSAVALTGIRFGNFWQNSHLAFLPAQLPLFAIGIGSFEVYRRLKGSSALTVSSWPASMFLVTALATQWHPVAMLLWAAAFGCLFSGDSDFSGEADIVTRCLALPRHVLNSRLLQWFGKISYSIYLLHWAVIVICLSVLLKYRPDATSAEALTWLLMVGLPLTLLSSVWLHNKIERPFMTLARNLPAMWSGRVRFRGRGGHSQQVATRLPQVACPGHQTEAQSPGLAASRPS